MMTFSSSREPITTLLVDLDDTLYDSKAMSEQVAENIRKYMVQKLGIATSVCEEMCRELYLNYGTTLAGLVANGYTIDYDDWHADVHGSLDYEKYLKPDPNLKQLLDKIPVPKYIFTNADIKHTERCLSILGISDCFVGIICFESIMEAGTEQGIVHNQKPVLCKPNRQAFKVAMGMAGMAEAKNTAFFDDSTRNITSSHSLGIYSILVGRTGIDCPSDVQLQVIHDLPKALPWLVAIGDGRPAEDCSAMASPEAEELLEEGRHKTALTVPA